MHVKPLQAAALLVAGLATASAGARELSIGTEGGYPPWSMADAGGNVTGFDADVAAALCAKIERDCTFVVQAFDGLIPALRAKRFDLIISGMSITDERAKQIAFSVGYAELANRFVVKKGSDLVAIDDIPALLEALDGVRVGVQAGTTHAAFVSKLAPGADLKSYDTLDQMQIDLATGRIDTAFADVTALQDFLDRPDGADFTFTDASITSTYDATLGSGVGVGMRREDTELKAEIDAALCELVADGSIAEASRTWFKIDISRPCE